MMHLKAEELVYPDLEIIRRSNVPIAKLRSKLMEDHKAIKGRG